jgi:hypothetical protein
MTEHITHTNAVRRLERSSSDKMLAGVAGTVVVLGTFAIIGFRLLAHATRQHRAVPARV